VDTLINIGSSSLLFGVVCMRLSVKLLPFFPFIGNNGMLFPLYKVIKMDSHTLSAIIIFGGTALLIALMGYLATRREN